MFNAERYGRFLDTPEFRPVHDIGNTGTVFDRFDFHPGGRDALHVDVLAAGNWLQVPNTYDQARQDQKQKVVLSISPPVISARWTRRRSRASMPFTARRCRLLSEPQPSRRLSGDGRTEAVADELGLRADLARSRGRHNWKAGLHTSQTRLDEQFSLGITDPGFNEELCPTISRGRAAVRLQRQAEFINSPSSCRMRFRSAIGM